MVEHCAVNVSTYLTYAFKERCILRFNRYKRPVEAGQDLLVMAYLTSLVVYLPCNDSFTVK